MATATKKPTVQTSTANALLQAYQGVLDEVKQEALNEISELRTEAVNELAEKRAEWEKGLAREKEQAAYEFDIEKRNREEALDRDTKSHYEALDKETAAIREREQAVKASENELADLKQQVDTFEDRLKKSWENGYGTGKTDATHAAETAASIESARSSAEVMMLGQRIDMLEAALATEKATSAELRKAVEYANERVGTVAKEAFASHGQAKVNISNAPSK